MQHVKITINGVTPLLLHRFTDAAQQKATAGSGTSIAVGDHGTPREQAEECLYLDEHGTIIMPGPNLFRCLIEAGKFFKIGKKQITTQKSSLIPAVLELNELAIPINYDEDWTVDTRPVRIPATGGRILRHRPCFNNWGLTFTLGIETEEMNEKLVRQIVDAAGRKIGLGDFRPDCKGPFGKFVVDSWQTE